MATEEHIESVTTRVPLENGSAELRIRLRDHGIEVRHGETGELLAQFKNAPFGIWGRLWRALESLGITRVPQ